MKPAEEWCAEGGLNTDAAEITHRRAIQADALREAAEIAEQIVTHEKWTCGTSHSIRDAILTRAKEIEKQ